MHLYQRRCESTYSATFIIFVPYSFSFLPYFLFLVKQLQEIPMDSGSSAIVFCSVADPHLILMTTDGSIIYGKLIEDFSGARLKLQKSSIDKVNLCVNYGCLHGNVCNQLMKLDNLKFFDV